MVHRFKVEVIQTSEVEVTIDDESVNEDFMAEFRESFYPFTTLQEHAEHLAQMFARGLYSSSGFIEGYGYLNDETKEPNVKATVRITDENVETETIKSENNL